MDAQLTYTDFNGEFTRPLILSLVANHTKPHEIKDWYNITCQLQNTLKNDKFIELINELYPNSMYNITENNSYKSYRKIGNGIIDTGLLIINRSGNLVTFDISGETRIECANKILVILDQYIIKEVATDDVKIVCSYITPNGVNTLDQIIKCPSLDDIKDNYPTQVANNINKLINIEKPWKHGKLIIWNGKPGTGKTYAIRSLMREWKQKMKACVVTDPEIFLDRPQYYYQMIESFGNSRMLFILEDNADLVIKESRKNNYGLARLLNLTDGIIGQGRDDIFFITFNEEIGSIDEAFLRPGRRLQHLEFEYFGKDEAAKWLKAHGNETIPSSDMSLAEMYALIGNIVTLDNEKEDGVGFGFGFRSVKPMMPYPCR